MPGRERVSNVNWRKVIDNFRSGYQLGAPWEILVVELLANSLDAGARRIWIELEGEYPKVLRVVDDGRGMGNKEFVDYHNLGSLTKSRGYGIGWAGIGAKLYIDRCQEIYTETRSTKYRGASRWSFPKTEIAPVWREVDVRGLLGGSTGTAVEIVLSDKKDCQRISEEALKSGILANYNYVLEPLGSVVVSVNHDRIAPLDPRASALKVESVRSRLKEGGWIGGVLCLLPEDAPPGFALISIVVHGKTVGEQYDFRQFARIQNVDRISGYIQCDDLIHVTTTSKDNFNKRTSTWRDFDKKAGRIFSEWLQTIGQLRRTEPDRSFEDLAKEIARDVNRVLKLPEIGSLNLDLFHKFTRRLAVIADPEGGTLASEVTGQQLVPGTVGGPGDGEGVPVPGDDPGTGLLGDPEGETPSTQKQRRMRGGIQIAFDDVADRPERGWPDPGLQAIVVNRQNPAFQCAEALAQVSFYTIDVCFQVLCEVIEDESERTSALEALFQGFLRVTG